MSLITQKLRLQQRRLQQLGAHRAHLVLAMVTTSARLLMSSVLGILPRMSLAAGSISVRLITRKLRLRRKKLLPLEVQQVHPGLDTATTSARPLMNLVPGIPPRTSLAAGSTSVSRITRKLRLRQRKLLLLLGQLAHLDMATTNGTLENHQLCVSRLLTYFSLQSPHRSSDRS